MKNLEVEDSEQVHAAFLVYMDLKEGEADWREQAWDQGFPTSRLKVKRSMCLQCVSGQTCPVSNILSCRWFCWKGRRRKKHPPKQFFHCLPIGRWATKGNTQPRSLRMRLEGWLTEVVLCSGLQHPSGVGQRLPCAAVCCGLRLHPGLPEDDWRAGHTWPPHRTLSGSQKKAAALRARTCPGINRWRTRAELGCVTRESP